MEQKLLKATKKAFGGLFECSGRVLFALAICPVMASEITSSKEGRNDWFTDNASTRNRFLV